MSLNGLKLLVAILFFTQTVFASCGHTYLRGTFDYNFAHIERNNTQVIYNSGLTDAYTSNGRYNQNPEFGFGVGYEFPGNDPIVPGTAIGAELYITPSNFRYSGHLVETATGNASSALYSYQYIIRAARLMAEVQFTWHLADYFLPFISAGIGPTFLRLSDYSEQPTDNIGFVALPPFQAQTNVNFAYQIGLGASIRVELLGPIMVKNEERISLGYRYVSLGSASFGSRGSSYPYRLNMGNFTMQEIFLDYTYFL